MVWDEGGMLPLTDSESEEEKSEPLKSVALSSDSEDDDLREAIRMSLQLNNRWKVVKNKRKAHPLLE